MRPDDRRRESPLLASHAIPGDADFEEIEAELAAAGARVRRRAESRPSGAFAAALRRRLVDAAATAAAEEPRVVAPSMVIAGDGPVVVEPIAVRARPRPRASGAPVRSRGLFLAAAAALIVALVGLNASALPVPAASRVTAAIGADLIRGGATSPLTPGAELRTNDEIRTGTTGSATLQLGESRVRLAAGTDLRILGLAVDRIELDQIAGRAWHRVSLPARGQYVVITDTVTWTATGTAFDLDRSADGGTAEGDVVHELSVHHAVVAAGTGLLLTVPEGHGATVRLGARPTIETLAVAGSTAVLDPWIRTNASADAATGLPLGMLEGTDVALATPRPTADALASASGSPTPSGIGPSSPEPSSSATTGPAPTVRPTPRPTPAPTFGSMGLSAFACPGGVTLDWTMPAMEATHHVQVLRGASADIPARNPTGGGIVAFDGGYSADPAKASGFDRTEVSGPAWYRAVAFNAVNKAIAASDVRAVTTEGPGDLGSLGVSGSTPGQFDFAWTPFAGPADCFTFYKIVKSADDPTPSYLNGATAIAAIGDQSTAGATIAGLPSGGTYWFRVEAIRVTSLGKFVAAASTVIQATVP